MTHCQLATLPLHSTNQEQLLRILQQPRCRIPLKILTLSRPGIWMQRPKVIKHHHPSIQCHPQLQQPLRILLPPFQRQALARCTKIRQIAICILVKLEFRCWKCSKERTPQRAISFRSNLNGTTYTIWKGEKNKIARTLTAWWAISCLNSSWNVISRKCQLFKLASIFSAWMTWIFKERVGFLFLPRFLLLMILILVVRCACKLKTVHELILNQLFGLIDEKQLSCIGRQTFLEEAHALGLKSQFRKKIKI